MIYSQASRSIDISERSRLKFIMYKNKTTQGESKDTRSWKPLITRTNYLYMSFHLELVYD